MCCDVSQVVLGLWVFGSLGLWVFESFGWTVGDVGRRVDWTTYWKGPRPATTGKKSLEV